MEQKELVAGEVHKFDNGVPGSSSAVSNSTCANVAACEPIAIVGLACRLPGAVNSPSQLWDLLMQGRSGHGEVPKERFNASGFYHPDPSRPGSLPSVGGYFLQHDVRKFDNAFFGLNNLEAKHIDPQQRQLLEVVYECLENGGQPLAGISGSNTGCFVANFTNDYSMMQYKDVEYSSHYSGTGAAASILANRLNHVFDLHGPSSVTDTACSSSLYSLHSACNALHGEDCDAAIVASANLIQSPEQHLQAVKAGILSPDSVCHTYDESANGYGRAEGVSALFLKRLDDALRDGDPIRSIIRGTAVNSSGKTAGMSMPSAEFQASVVRKAYARAGLPLDETQYVEAHGTGTAIGDPIEIDGLGDAFRPTAGSNKLLVGSIKTNLGHSEGASGLSSIIKVVLALESKQIPPTIGINKLNPQLEAHSDRISIVRKCIPWPDVPIRRSGVNSFGFGGANGHVILEDAAHHCQQQRAEKLFNEAVKRFMMPCSAHTEASLKQWVHKLWDYTKHHDYDVQDLAYTLCCKRSLLSSRCYIVAAKDDFPAACKTQGLEVHHTTLQQQTDEDTSLVFVFTGQGTQWPQMGSGLIQRFRVFRDTISRLDAILRAIVEPPSWTLNELLQSQSNSWDINTAAIAQPLCTAVQIALVNLLRDWNLRPGAVVGHSSGEIAAGYCAERLTAEEAILIAYYRGVVVSESTDSGAMAAVGLEQPAVEAAISDAGLSEKVQVACINSPESITVSGDADAVGSLVARFEAQDVFARTLKTHGRAYHSHHMRKIGRLYETMLQQISWRLETELPMDVRMVSSVHGRDITSTELRNPKYWRENFSSQVRFGAAITNILNDNRCTFLEIGPHNALKMPLQQTWSKRSASPKKLSYFSSLVRPQPSVDSLLDLAGQLFINGYNISTKAVNDLQSTKMLVDLPNNVWKHDELLWNESRASREFRNRKYPRHYLLGAKIPGTSGIIWSWRNILRARDVPWAQDHKVADEIVLPAVAFVSIAAECLRQHQGLDTISGAIIIRNMKITKPLVIPDDDVGVEIVTDFQALLLSMASRSSTQFMFEISSFAETSPVSHATGQISIEHNHFSWPLHCCDRNGNLETRSAKTWYDSLAAAGLKFGPQFQILRQIHTVRQTGDDNNLLALAEMKGQESCSTDLSRSEDAIPIPVLDSLLQTAIISNARGLPSRVIARVPVSIEELYLDLTMKVNQGTVRAQAEFRGSGVTQNTAIMFDCDDRLIFKMGNIRLHEYNTLDLHTTTRDRNPILRVRWQPDICLLGPKQTPQLERHLSSTIDPGIENKCPALQVYSTILGLVLHKSSDTKLLLVSAGPNDFVESALKDLQAVSGLQRLRSVTLATLGSKGLLGKTFDDITAIGFEYREAEFHELQSNIAFDFVVDVTGLGAKEGSVVDLRMLKFDAVFSRDALYLALHEGNNTSAGQFAASHGSVLLDKTYDGFAGVPHHVTLVRSKQSQSDLQFTGTLPPIYLVFYESLSLLDETLMLKVRRDYEIEVQAYRLDAVDLIEFGSKPNVTIIVTVECQQHILSNLTSNGLSGIQKAVQVAGTLVWLTSEAMMEASKPLSALALGLSRALMLEQPALRFYVIDVEADDSHSGVQQTCHNIQSVLENGSCGKGHDFELIQRNGILWSSRLVPDEKYNCHFQSKQQNGTETAPPSQIGKFELICSQTGQIDSLHVRALSPNSELKSGFVEVRTKAVGLNFKDLCIVEASIDTRYGNCALESSGVIERSYATDPNLKSGDRVVVMAPQKICSTAVYPDWACLKLLDHEAFATVSALPLVFSTAIYALELCAQLEESDSVLIHSAAGGLGQATIQIAQLTKAKIFATVGTDEKKAYLVAKYGLHPQHIFSSRDDAFSADVMSATDGRGVDVVVNSLTGDLLHATLRCCAEFARFIEVGRRDIQDFGRMDMSIFNLNRDITRPGHGMFSEAERETDADTELDRLLQRTITLFREHKIHPIEPLTTVNIAEAPKAYRALQSRTRRGTVALSFEDQDTPIEFEPRKYDSVLDPYKQYLMVGALGGLGRSISTWMFERGARKFTFLNRSGQERDSARTFVAKLEAQGAEVLVVKGSADNEADVNKAVASATYPIVGVVHAAMGLDEALFSDMTLEQWNRAIRPKVDGSWNIHHALSAHEESLDFFLLTSSISGTVGTATESNYCAANSFQDAFARYRRGLGLKAVSIGFGMISEVGYLHEHPDIEKLLLRKGIHPINEEECLQIVDIAISKESQAAHTPGHSNTFAPRNGHMLTGLELLGLDTQRKLGFEGHSHVLDDPRASLLAFNYHKKRDQKSASGAISGTSAIANLDTKDPDCLRQSVKEIVVQKIANLVLVAPEQLNASTHISEFGMDSMLAAEFRGHVFHMLGVDVSFMTLLGTATTIGTLTDLIMEQMEKKTASDDMNA